MAVEHEHVATKRDEEKLMHPSLLSEYTRRSFRLYGMPNCV